MQKSDWRKEMQLTEAPAVVAPLIKTAIKGKVISDVIKGVSGVVKQGVKTTGDVAKTATSAAGTALSAAQKVGKAISGREKTASQKKIIKTGGIKAARDMDGDGKLEKKRSGGEFQETLLYDVVHNYIIAENFASDTESANKVMLKLSDELMQEIYERTMTASEKRKDTMLKKKYDDSDMKKNMQGQYGKEEGKKVYFATIRKQAMKKEEVEVDECWKTHKQVGYKKKGGKMVPNCVPKNEEVIPEAKYEAGASTYGKASIRNKRKFGTSGEMPDIMTGKKITKDATRGELISKRREEHKAKRGMKEEVGISSTVMMDKAKKEAMIRKKERDAVIKKLRKEEVKGDKVVKIVKAVADEKKRKNALQIQKYIGEVKRDEYGDPVGGPKITKKQLKKNLAANAPDEDHTNTTAEGYGSDRVGPALTMARVVDKVNPRPKPNSKRTAISRALKMASIKKDEKIRKRKENPYSTDKKLKMVATSIRDRVKQKAKSIMKSEDYIPEEGYDQIKDRIAMAGGDPSSPKKMDATKYPVSKEIKNQKGKTVLQKQSEKKYGKGKSALDIVKADIRKKHGKGAIMSTKK